jgi:hypothetical protein
MTEADVRRLVRREIDSIRVAESGVLPPTPYVVVEIMGRMKTLKPWEGVDASLPIGRALRGVVEGIIKGEPKVKAISAQDFDLDLRCLHPKDVVELVGAKKHRHVREISLKAG